MIEADRSMLRTYERFWTVLNIIACIAAAAICIGTMTMVVQGWTAVPYADQWWNLLSRHDLTWTWLFAQHNEHRIAIPRLLFALDYVWLGETYKIDLVSNIVFQSAGVAMLAIGFAQSSRAARPYWLIAAATAAAVMFSAMQFENFLWGFQIQFFGVGVFTLAAISVVAQVESERAAVPVFAILALLATFTLASGVLCGYVAIVVCVLRRRSWTMLGCICILTALLTGAYLHGYISPPYHSNPAETVKHPLRLLAYSVVELGSIFPPLLGGWSSIGAGSMGGIGDLLFALLGARLILSRNEARGFEVSAFGLSAFALGMTLITAMGRLGPDVVPTFTSRYATPVGLFWLGLTLAWLSIAARRWHRLADAVAVVCTIWVVAIAVSQHRFIAPAIAEKRALAAVAPALLAGVEDPVMLHRTDPFDTGKPIQWRDALKAARTSVFGSAWTRLTAVDLPGDGGRICAQADHRITRIDSALHPGWRITGRLTGAKMREPHILFLNDAGRTVGYGIGGFDAASVDRTAATVDQSDWWIGETTEDPATLRGRVLSADPNELCALMF